RGGFPAPPPAIMAHALAAVGARAGAEPCGNFGDRGVPVDALDRAAGAPPEGVEHALTAAVLVVIEPQRFLAGIALRGGMPLVSADLLEAAAVLAAELHEDAAVALAEDARRRLPF